MSPDAGPPPGQLWTILARGSFLFGKCEVCAFVSPGRRAQYSVESDMRAHEVICHANRMVDLASVRQTLAGDVLSH